MPAVACIRSVVLPRSVLGTAFVTFSKRGAMYSSMVRQQLDGADGQG